MTMFVDACAIISIMTGEETAHDYTSELERSPEACTSAMAAWEAILILARPEQFGCSFAKSQAFVLRWLEERHIEILEPNSPRDVLAFAVSVAEKHSVSKRSLSALDCFHYAYAKALEVPLLTLDQALRKTDVTCLP